MEERVPEVRIERERALELREREIGALQLEERDAERVVVMRRGVVEEHRLRTLLQGAKRDLTYVETVPRKGYRFREPVAIIAGQLPRQHARHWTRRYLPYAVLALLASLMAILFAPTRYDKFVPVQGARAVTAAGGSSHHSKR